MDFGDHNVIFVRWITPEKNESMQEYATRLRMQVKDMRPVLIGLSFGGMIAQEIAKQIDTEKVLIISSVRTGKELPFIYRLAGKLRLHKIIPAALFKRSTFLTEFLFGAKADFEKRLLKNILADTDEAFLKWAIDRTLCWENRARPANLVHIHGTADRILPYRSVKADIGIEGGSHLMISDKAKELSRIITGLLSSDARNTSLRNS